jgi:hypothetical protein
VEWLPGAGGNDVRLTATQALMVDASATIEDLVAGIEALESS